MEDAALRNKLRLPGFKKGDYFKVEFIPLDDMEFSANLLEVIDKVAALNPNPMTMRNYKDWVRTNLHPRQHNMPLKALVENMNAFALGGCSDFLCFLHTLQDGPCYVASCGPTSAPVLLPDNTISFRYPAVLTCHCDLHGFPVHLMAYSRLRDMSWFLFTTGRPETATSRCGSD